MTSKKVTDAHESRKGYKTIYKDLGLHQSTQIVFKWIQFKATVTLPGKSRKPQRTPEKTSKDLQATPRLGCECSWLNYQNKTEQERCSCKDSNEKTTALKRENCCPSEVRQRAHKWSTRLLEQCSLDRRVKVRTAWPQWETLFVENQTLLSNRITWTRHGWWWECYGLGLLWCLRTWTACTFDTIMNSALHWKILEENVRLSVSWSWTESVSCGKTMILDIQADLPKNGCRRHFPFYNGLVKVWT